MSNLLLHTQKSRFTTAVETSVQEDSQKQQDSYSRQNEWVLTFEKGHPLYLLTRDQAWMLFRGPTRLLLQ